MEPLSVTALLQTMADDNLTELIQVYTNIDLSLRFTLYSYRFENRIVL